MTPGVLPTCCGQAAAGVSVAGRSDLGDRAAQAGADAHRTVQAVRWGGRSNFRRPRPRSSRRDGGALRPL